RISGPASTADSASRRKAFRKAQLVPSLSDARRRKPPRNPQSGHRNHVNLTDIMKLGVIMSAANSQRVAPLVDHFFRHEAGRRVSVLTRCFGWRNFQLVEDMVQATLVDALSAWRVQAPDNPSGWVHRVARNKILDAMRRNKIDQRATSGWVEARPLRAEAIDDWFLDTEIEDSQLRMMFACCHPHLARENQLALTLKALCGCGNAEIARALLATEETIKKRIQRATRDLLDRQIALDPPPAEEIARRLDSVH